MKLFVNILRLIKYLLKFIFFEKKTYLCFLSVIFLSDKAGHRYTYYYHQLFKNLTQKKINFLEIGIFRGSSIRMWANYFKKANIYGIDNCEINTSGELLCDENILGKLNEIKNIKCFKCNQDDKIKIEDIFKNQIFDIVIDDGSHFIRDQLISLGILFEKLKPGGIYVIEDIAPVFSLQTGSWWGQKNGPEDTDSNYHGGKGYWKESYKKNQKLKDEIFFSDSTWAVLNNFIKNKIFYSEYLSNKNNRYLTENIISIDIVSSGVNKPIFNSLGIEPMDKSYDSILNSGCLAIIKKKN